MIFSGNGVSLALGVQFSQGKVIVMKLLNHGEESRYDNWKKDLWWFRHCAINNGYIFYLQYLSTEECEERL
ncbi:hypothetical protein NCCP2222_27700 [Sporosarcina sp. NCCP-2222]|nr:hypothetical protein NCCP2222_27700 [Sporosarcina sp. NCCP-2222]